MSEKSYFFYPDDVLFYTPIAVIKEMPNGVTVQCMEDMGGKNYKKKAMIISKKEFDSKAIKCLTLQVVEDMCDLPDLSDAALLYNLRIRFSQDKIYSTIGTIYCAMNPFKKIKDCYSQWLMERYYNAVEDNIKMEPHIYHLASQVFHNMINLNQNQACLISGESGSGKTETMKHILRFITTASDIYNDNYEYHEKEKQKEQEIRKTLNQQKNNKKLLLKSDSKMIINNRINRESEIIERNKNSILFLKTQPITEAFGNAKTLHNNNSSRFGKWTVINFDREYHYLGASVVDYLLEKSRISYFVEGERNYHIFYQLFAACQHGIKTTHNNELLSDMLKLDYQNIKNYNYLNFSSCTTIDGIDDLQDFNDVYDGLNAVVPEQVFSILKIVASVLHIGNVDYREKSDSNNTVTFVEASLKLIEIISNLLEVPFHDLKRCLTERKFSLKGRSSITMIPYTMQEAIQYRDALGKAIYSRLFTWLIKTMNSIIMKDVKELPDNRIIGILDIFGFEIFDNNSFEQLCINYCNEKLQYFFNNHIFSIELQVFRDDGINVDEFKFSDNSDLLALLESKPRGIYAVMDEEINVPNGSDQTFHGKLYQYHGKGNVRFKRPKGEASRKCFTLNHFAGDVMYNSDNFLDKNKDTLLEDLRETMALSENKIVKELFSLKDEPEATSTTGKGGKKKKLKTLGSQFRESLDSLVKVLGKCEPNFVRCIKSNTFKQPNIFDSSNVVEQLRYSGLLEVCRVRKETFRFRFTHEQFYKKYEFCAKPKDRDTFQDFVQSFKDRGIIDPEFYRIGITKIFFKDLKLLDELLSIAQFKAEELMNKYLLGWWINFRHRTKYMPIIKDIKDAVNVRDAVKIENSLKRAKSILPYQGGSLKCINMAKRILKQKAAEIHCSKLIMSSLDERDLKKADLALKEWINQKGDEKVLDGEFSTELGVEVAKLIKLRDILILEEKCIIDLTEAVKSLDISLLKKRVKEATDLKMVGLGKQEKFIVTKAVNTLKALHGLNIAIQDLDFGKLASLMDIANENLPKSSQILREASDLHELDVAMESFISQDIRKKLAASALTIRKEHAVQYFKKAETVAKSIQDLEEVLKHVKSIHASSVEDRDQNITELRLISDKVSNILIKNRDQKDAPQVIEAKELLELYLKQKSALENLKSLKTESFLKLEIAVNECEKLGISIDFCEELVESKKRVESCAKVSKTLQEIQETSYYTVKDLENYIKILNEMDTITDKNLLEQLRSTLNTLQKQTTDLIKIEDAVSGGDHKLCDELIANIDSLDVPPESKELLVAVRNLLEVVNEENEPDGEKLELYQSRCIELKLPEELSVMKRARIMKLRLTKDGGIREKAEKLFQEIYMLHDLCFFSEKNEDEKSMYNWLLECYDTLLDNANDMQEDIKEYKIELSKHGIFDEMPSYFLKLTEKVNSVEEIVKSQVKTIDFLHNGMMEWNFERIAIGLEEGKKLNLNGYYMSHGKKMMQNMLNLRDTWDTEDDASVIMLAYKRLKKSAPYASDCSIIEKEVEELVKDLEVAHGLKNEMSIILQTVAETKASTDTDHILIAQLQRKLDKAYAIGLDENIPEVADIVKTLNHINNRYLLLNQIKTLTDKKDLTNLYIALESALEYFDDPEEFVEIKEAKSKVETMKKEADVSKELIKSLQHFHLDHIGDALYNSCLHNISLNKKQYDHAKRVIEIATRIADHSDKLDKAIKEKDLDLLTHAVNEAEILGLHMYYTQLSQQSNGNNNNNNNNFDSKNDFNSLADNVNKLWKATLLKRQLESKYIIRTVDFKHEINVPGVNPLRVQKWNRGPASYGCTLILPGTCSMEYRKTTRLSNIEEKWIANGPVLDGIFQILQGLKLMGDLAKWSSVCTLLECHELVQFYETPRGLHMKNGVVINDNNHKKNSRRSTILLKRPNLHANEMDALLEALEELHLNKSELHHCSDHSFADDLFMNEFSKRINQSEEDAFKYYDRNKERLFDKLMGIEDTTDWNSKDHYHHFGENNNNNKLSSSPTNNKFGRGKIKSKKDIHSNSGKEEEEKEEEEENMSEIWDRLPYGWTIKVSKKKHCGRIFYHNKFLKKTQWHHPAGPKPLKIPNPSVTTIHPSHNQKHNKQKMMK